MGETTRLTIYKEQGMQACNCGGCKQAGATLKDCAMEVKPDVDLTRSTGYNEQGVYYGVWK